MNAYPLSLVVSFFLAGPAEPPAPDVREELEALGSALETAVGRVSRPTRVVVVARNAPRGYRLPGYGAMFVLAPRSLPPPASPRAAAEHQAARALAAAAQQIEESLARVQSDEVRLSLERNLKALRESEAALRRGQGVRLAAALPEGEAPLPPSPPAAPADLLALEREMQVEFARQAEAIQRQQAARGEMDLIKQEELDRELRAMHERAEAIRIQAERALQEAHRGALQAVPGAPEAPKAASPTTPPWQSWLDFDPREAGQDLESPEAAVAGVRAAITSVLETQGARLQGMGPEEVVAVAVDFVPQTRMTFRPRAQKTLLVRVAKKTIEARRAGRISPEEFRKRVEVLEY